MPNPGIQVILDTYVDRAKPHNMTEGAIKDLKNDILHETGGERVEHTLVGDQFSVSVWVLGVEYKSEVQLEQMPLRSEFVAHPATVEHVFHNVSDEDKDAASEKMAQDQEEANAKNQEQADVAQAEEAGDKPFDDDHSK